MFPMPILPTAPTAIKTAVSVTRLELVIDVSGLDYPTSLNLPASLKPLVKSLSLISQ